MTPANSKPQLDKLVELLRLWHGNGRTLEQVLHSERAGRKFPKELLEAIRISGGLYDYEQAKKLLATPKRRRQRPVAPAPPPPQPRLL